MPLSQLAQTNGTVDTFYKYKDRVMPTKITCQLPNAMCTPDKICKPGYSVVKKLNGMFCCPNPSTYPLPKTGSKGCVKIGLGFPYDIKPHPQTHDQKTFDRERHRNRHQGRTGGALHQNKVAEPDNGMSPIMTYLLFGGLGYLGYKGYKKFKKK